MAEVPEGRFKGSRRILNIIKSNQTREEKNMNSLTNSIESLIDQFKGIESVFKSVKGNLRTGGQGTQDRVAVVEDLILDINNILVEIPNLVDLTEKELELSTKTGQNISTLTKKFNALISQVDSISEEVKEATMSSNTEEMGESLEAMKDLMEDSNKMGMEASEEANDLLEKLADGAETPSEKAKNARKDEELLDSISALSSLTEKSKATLSRLSDDISRGVEGSADSLGDAIAGQLGIPALGDSVSFLIGGLGVKLVEFIVRSSKFLFGKLFNAVKALPKLLIRTATKTFPAMFKALGTTIQKGLSSALASPLKAIGAIGKAFGKILTPVVGVFLGIKNVRENLGLVGNQIASTTDFLSSMLAEGLEFFSFGILKSEDIAKRISSVFDLFGDAVEGVKNLLRKIPGVGAIVDARDKVKETVTSGFQGILDNVSVSLFGPGGMFEGRFGTGNRPTRPSRPQRPSGASPFETVEGFTLGQSTARFESQGDVGAVSTGVGDKGGKSYGAIQLSSEGGSNSSIANFIRGSQFRDEFAGLQIGSAQFDAKFQEIASRNPEAFLREQKDYNFQNNVQPIVDRLKENGINFTTAPPAIKEMIYSIGTQFGPTLGYRVLQRALDLEEGQRIDTQLDASEVVQKVFDEKNRRTSSGELAYFQSSSASVQAGVANRFRQEEEMANYMLSSFGGGGSSFIEPLSDIPMETMLASNGISPVPTEALTSRVTELGGRPQVAPQQELPPIIVQPAPVTIEVPQDRSPDIASPSLMLQSGGNI